MTMIPLIPQLYAIESSIRNFDNDQRSILTSYQNIKYNFENEKLQREIGIEKLKVFFFQYIKKNVTPSSVDAKKINQILKITRKTKQSLLVVISEKYEELKTIQVDNMLHTISIIMLKIMYLIESEILTIDGVENDIKYIESIYQMDNKIHEIQDILDLTHQRKILLPGQKKQKSAIVKQLSKKIKNTIFNKIFNIKQKIFTEQVDEKLYENLDEESEQYDKVLARIFKKQDQQDIFHIYITCTHDKITKFKNYFEFIFDLKSRSNNDSIDDIIQDSIFSLFDEYHTHFDFMLDQQDSFFSLPFKYEKDNCIYVVESTLIDYLTALQSYKHINFITEYFINYLFDREYVSKFFDHKITFYFAAFKGFLRIINYQNPNQSSQLSKILKVEVNKTREKRIFKKNSFINEEGYNKLIDIDEATILLISNVQKISDDGETTESNLKIYLDLMVSISKYKLERILRNNFPKTWMRKKKILEKRNIVTFKQLENSELFEKYIKVKEQKEETDKETDKKENKNEDNFEYFDFENIKNFKNIKNIKLHKEPTLTKLQTNLDIMQFKIQYGLITTENNIEKQNYEKLLYNVDENNRNIILSSNLESKITILTTLAQKENNDIQKTLLFSQINSLTLQMKVYKSKIKDIASNGFQYGTNFEEEQHSVGYVTSDIIKQTKKLQEMMKIINAVGSKKALNPKFNTFSTRLLDNFQHVQNELYELYSLFINHKVGCQFEKYLTGNYKSIQNIISSMSTKKQDIYLIGADFSRLFTIILFIIQNNNDNDKYYSQISLNKEQEYFDKFVKYQGNTGKVLEQKNDILYIQFENNIEKIDKQFVQIINNLEHKDVEIIKGPYKGFLGRVFQHIGDNISMTLDTYGLNNNNSKCHIRCLKMTVNDIRISQNLISSNQKICTPRNPENKDLYSISRFLFHQVTTNFDNDGFQYDDFYFNKLYSNVLEHVNKMIKINQERQSELEELKKTTDKSFHKMKSIYESDGLVDLKLTKLSFRTIFDGNSIQLKNNSENYLNEEYLLYKLNKIVHTPEEILQKELRYQQKKYDKFIKSSNNFFNIIDTFDFNIPY